MCEVPSAHTKSGTTPARWNNLKQPSKSVRPSRLCSPCGLKREGLCGS